MKLLTHLRLGPRLALGFGLVLALLLGTALLGIDRMGAVEERLETITNVNNQEARLAVEMRIAVNQIAIATRDVIIQTAEEPTRAAAARIELARANYDAAEAKLGRLFAGIAETTREEKDLFAQLQQLKAETRPLISRVVELGVANRAEEAARMMTEQVDGPQRRWLEMLGQLADVEERQSIEAAQQAQVAFVHARSVLVGLCAIGIALGLLAAWLITRSITRPLAVALRVAETVSAGDLTSRIETGARDETGQLLNALKAMNDSLVAVVSTVRTSSDSIATGAREIAAGNHDLSQRTEEQASNLQQTAASMEEINSTVQSSSEAAQRATELAGAATDAATRGGRVVEQVVSKMDAIAASSRRINDIIGVIDGIAFQTNILALNAAVEAARAGEHGRGFSVVASEVRSLATRSSTAAREVRMLIGDSVEKIEQGSAHAGDAGSAMRDIMDQVDRVAELIREIGSATREQTVGIGQVSGAVSQLDLVTQQNAALVEESAAAADSLNHQAARLVEAVGVFKLRPAA